MPAKIIRSLKVILTRDERFDLGDLLARQHQDIVKAEEAKKEITATLTAEDKAAQMQANNTARTLSNGYDYRDVECYWELKPEERRASLIRSDTFECVEVRPMTEKELQGELPLEVAEEPKVETGGSD